ncbi:tetratricopeptide repeat protein [Methylobacillus gramineus]|uniref:tetratricopeptide repeat protein n=1 Tax=Methylobacillus gramineus TaxID=755169 RepID=UPI001CFF803E|nr:tetratricopeptide repeat protein [Methylobacillus gramineus]MCB5184294.1 tetratricopeptide repeat protein [Methylobacillus gramineus]
MKNVAVSLLLCILSVPAWAADPADPCFKALSDDQPEQAIVLADQLLTKQRQQRNVLICKGRAQLNLGQAEAAIATFREAEPLASNPQETMISFIFKGNAYKAAGKYAEAQASYEQALKLANSEKSQKFQVITHTLAGEALELAKQLPQALKHYQDALALAGNNNERAEANAHIAGVYSTQGNYNEAIPHQLKAVVMELSDGTFDEYANAAIELGHMYILAKDYVSAEKNLNRVIEKSRSAGDGYWVAKGYYMLGLSYIASSQLAQAKTTLKQSEEIALEIGAEKLAAEVNQQLKSLSE